MGSVFRVLLFIVLRLGISARYRVRVVGLDKVKKRHGVLLLANHVSILDPVVVQLVSWWKLAPRPVVTKKFFDKPVLRHIFSTVRAIPAPDFFVGKNCYKEDALEETFEAIIKGLHAGDNILFYPAGRLKTDSKENIQGTSGLKRLKEMEPNLSVVMVRTTGLWGSAFSTAPHGRSPDLFKQVAFVLKSLACSLLFFMPKRDVTVEFEEGFPEDINGWFNKPYPDGEPLCLPPYSPFSKTSPFTRKVSIPSMEAQEDPLLDEVIALIGKEGVTPTTHLAYDLGMDSLEIAELFTALQAKYDLIDLYASELATPQHIVAMIRGKWRSERHLDLLKKFEAEVSKVRGALFDPQLGWQGQKAIDKRVATFSARFSMDERKELPLLLPAGVDAYAAFLAAKRVGKIPLFLKAKDHISSGVYTTEDMIYFGHGLTRHDSIILLKRGGGGRSNPLKGQPLINALYHEDPLKSMEAAEAALRENRPVLFVCSLTPNATWAYRARSALKESELLLSPTLKDSWERVCGSITP